MLLRHVKIENFRGLSQIEVELDATTVLIGENNTGKTSFLEALCLCLARPFSRKGNPFEDYDYHLADESAAPQQSPRLAITLEFAEEQPDEWDIEIAQVLLDVVQFDDRGLRHIILRVTSQFDDTAGDFVSDWEFLDIQGNGLGPKAKRQQTLAGLQRFNPIFYLSALRDAAREFNPRSDFWGRFLRNPSIAADVRQKLEEDLVELNERVISSETRLQGVTDKLSQVRKMVSMGGQNTVGIEAVPSRVWELLSRAQVRMAGATGAKIPLAKHGTGTQSLSVLFLYEAFLESGLGQAYDKLSTPILALEEPEAHLHPCAVRTLWDTLNKLKGQKLIATHSGDLLAEVPLSAIRRFCHKKGRVEVRCVQPGTLDDKQTRQINFHLRSTRGELLFARCWLLVEGPTEYWVFSETARVLEIDLEQLGIRILNYRNADTIPFVKVADELGIGWHCVADGDTGQKELNRLTPLLAARTANEHVTILPFKDMELLLCESGFGHVYLPHMDSNKKHLLTAKPGDIDYWSQVRNCLPGKSYWKEPAALEVMAEMKTRGKSSVPQKLQEIIEAAQKLAGI